VNPHTNPVCIRSRLELLRKSPLFEKLTDEELAALSAHAHLISFKAGQPVWRAGAPVDTLYKLVAGKLELTSAVRQVRRRRTANLWQGKCRIFAT
jgi:signal-transduction protein with cAMP-binding, CBS, and nucleotidyltransferase domain